MTGHRATNDDSEQLRIETTLILILTNTFLVALPRATNRSNQSRPYVVSARPAATTLCPSGRLVRSARGSHKRFETQSRDSVISMQVVFRLGVQGWFSPERVPKPTFLTKEERHAPQRSPRVRSELRIPNGGSVCDMKSCGPLSDTPN